MRSLKRSAVFAAPDHRPHLRDDTPSASNPPDGGNHTSDESLKKRFVKVVPESLPATNRI